MKTIALRFADNFAPEEGTIISHSRLMEKNGCVWYGKLGAAVSQKVIDEIMKNDSPKILLIHSGKVGRYWLFIDKIQHSVPDKKLVPEYYREFADNFNTWFRIVKIENAPSNVLSICKVASSGRPLSEVSKSSMSPYFIIEVEEDI